MQSYQEEFIRFAIDCGVLSFGEFQLKSGRVSPYFFNLGLFNTGGRLSRLGQFYAKAAISSGIAFDLLFGPAYKGIALATALALEYARRGRDVPVAFNRKEAKTHGEGGTLMGATLAGREVLIVDDVITAGTAINEAMAQIAAAGGRVAGIVIALDRQERVREDDARSAAQAIAREHAIQVAAVAGLDDLLAFTGDTPALQSEQARLLAYRARYGTR